MTATTHAPGLIRALRRLVLPIAALALTLFAFHAKADQKRIVVLETMTLPLVQEGTRWFRQGMQQLGYSVGDNVEYVILNADGSQGLARDLLQAELAQNQPDLVVSVATLASRSAYNLLGDSGIPQIFFFVTDPVKEGFVNALGQKSDRNITGRTHAIPASTKLTVANQILSTRPGDAKWRIGILHSTYPSSMSDIKLLMAAGQEFDNMEFTDLQFEYQPGEDGRQAMREAAVALLAPYHGKLDGVWLTNGPVGADMQFVDAIVATGMPVLYSNVLAAPRHGTLLALVSNAEINGLAAADLAHAVLNRRKANEIPVTRSEDLVIGINVSTSLALKTTVPSALLELAGADNIHR